MYSLGMSKRKLKTRTNEHIRAVKQCSEKSALATRVEKTGHTIDFEKITANTHNETTGDAIK